ncbi:MAG: sulfate ABC transporter permease subunit CysT [Candidatus Binataceae bacterium]
MKAERRRVIPGFGLTMGYTVALLGLFALIPLSTIFLTTAGMGCLNFWTTITSLRVLAAYQLSIGASLIGAAVNVIFGLAVAWSLVRYEFPAKGVLDAIVDIPFALPTSVAGITLTAIYAENGWVGRLLAPLGIKVAFTPLGVIVALVFIGLPFVVRTVQPVLRDLEAELEEASAPFLAIEFRKNDLTLRFFTTLTSFGTPHDVTLQELRIESFFPADEATEVAAQRLREADTARTDGRADPDVLRSLPR